METQTQNGPGMSVAIAAKPTTAELAKMAAQAQTEAEKTEAVKVAVRVIKADVKSTAGVSEGVFQVFITSKDSDAAAAAFVTAERQLVREWQKTDPTIKSMGDIAKASGVSNFSYVSIKNTMQAAVDSAELLCNQLQAWYDFNYDNMSEADQAKNAHDMVPEGFLNPWHTRYAKRNDDDEKGSTKFNRDRREAEAALKNLDNARKVKIKADKEAELRLQARLAADAARSTVTEDIASTGSPQTPSGIAGATTGARQAVQDALSVVLRGELSLFINALQGASEHLPDSVLVPIVARATDALVTLTSQAKDELRARATEHSKRPSGAAAELRALEGAETESKAEAEQTSLEPGDIALVKPASMQQEEWDSLNAEEKAEVMADPEAGLPDVPTDTDMTEDDKRNMESVG